MPSSISSFPSRALVALLFVGASATASATTEKYRVIWNSSPESSITVSWCQKDGDDPAVHYGLADAKELGSKHGVDRETSHLGMDSCFARLSGLKPDTLYAFEVRDSNSTSKRFTFRTAPDGPADFSFLAGGDSRNHRAARQRANRTAAKLRPLFICFGGDMISRPVAKDWNNWLDDWQLTTDANGHMIPIIAARGNHEGSKDIHSFFDTPNPDDYYAIDFGSGYLRVYTLNSNIVRAGSQGKWLGEDLAAHADTKWKVAHYHHPFRPHQSGKAEQHAQYNAWAPLFFKHGMDLAIECDSHVVKRTWPVKPSNAPGSDEGFIRDDAFGITFIGEGCWGAPLRSNDDNKDWTRASGSFNQINWICVSPEKLFTRTVKVDSADDAESVDPSDLFKAPKGLEIWEPESGAVVTLLPKGVDGRPSLDAAALARVVIAAEDKKFRKSNKVRIRIEGEAGEGAEIRYTLDGSDPSASSKVYADPIEIDSTTTVRAAIFRDGKLVTMIVEATFKR